MARYGYGMSVSGTRKSIVPSSGGVPFSPTDLSDLSLWLKADAGVTLSGANVTAWADQSGNGRNANTESIGNISLVAIGEKSFVSFTNSSMLIPTIWNGVSLIGTIFAVARFNSSSTEDYGSRIFFQQGDSDIFFTRGRIGTNNFYFASIGDAVISNVPANNNTNYLIETTFDSSAASLFLNGTSVGTGPIEENTVYDEPVIGQGEPYKMAEIVVYNRVLTTPERQQVEAYLMEKYAISPIPTPTPTLTPTPTPTPIPAIPGIDTNYVQDIYLTNSNNPGMNGVWTNVSEGFGFPAWVNYSYNGNVRIFAPNNGYSGGESWTFYDTDQGEPQQPSNPSSNPGSIPTSGWTQNVSISAYTWKYGNNNYLLLGGLVYDDTSSFFQMPANGLAVRRQTDAPYIGATPYTSDGGTFITYSNANGGTFSYTQNIPYEESYFQYTMATKTNSPSANGLPAYGYVAQTYITGNLIISPILYIPLSSASITVTELQFSNSDISDIFYQSQPFTKHPSLLYWYGAGDDHGWLRYNASYPSRWELGVYTGNTEYPFAFSYASSVSGVPLSGWVMSQDFISVTGYPRITKV